MSQARVGRVVPLIFGWEHLPKRSSVPLAPPSERDRPMREPIPGVLVETSAGWVLLDTGVSGALVRDRWLAERFWGSRPTKIELATAGDPLEDAFTLVGSLATGFSLSNVIRVAQRTLRNS